MANRSPNCDRSFGGRFPWLARLVAAGVVTPGTGKPLRPFRPIRLKGGVSLSDAIDEDREDRF